MPDAKDKAREYALKAYEELQKAGLSTEYLSILNDVVLDKHSAFFGKFGSDSGVSITVSSTNNPLSHFILTLVVTKYKRSWGAWIRDLFNTFVGKDCEYKVFLDDKDSTKLRDLFRNLEE